MESGNDRATEARGVHLFSLALGLWLVIAPFALHYSHTAATLNEILVGLAVAALSFVRLRSPVDSWASWAIAGLGLWLVLSPFIFGYAKTSTYWNELLFGILLIVLMISSLGQTIRHHSHLAH
jgi:hypothetical protein